MTIDKRFALITESGERLYPYQKQEQKPPRRYGFALSPPGKQDRFGQASYTTDLAAVIRHVVIDGWGVRARSEDRRLDGSYKLGKRTAKDFWLTPELSHILSGLADAPESSLLGSQGNSSAGSGTETQADMSIEALRRIEALSVDDYEEALETLIGLMNERQRVMIAGHAAAPNHTLSMEKIAALADFPNYESANLHYGKLGRLLADHFDVKGLVNQVQAIATECETLDTHGHAQWTLRPNLVEAMRQIGMVEDPAEPGFIAAAAEAEVDSDPENSALSATDRRALVNARLGQGGFRQRMQKIWGGRCAVTGCAIECALVASHAKPWSESNNAERLDAFNGLLLAASIDRLFDRGLISFTDEGDVLAAPSLDEDAMTSVGLSPDSRLSGVDKRHLPYLKAHRSKHGFENG